MLVTTNLDKVFDGEENSYIVLDLLGTGGFGHVFQIKNETDGSLWALKTLPPYASNEEDLKGFKNESEMALKVSHENAMRYKYVHDGSIHKDLPPYIIMELANEGSLNDYLKQKKMESEFLTVETLHQMFNQLIDGMEHINQELVHRDIKPDNILIKDGKLIITDFGLAKIANAATRSINSTFKGYGTYNYVAPEGWKFDRNTIQMDIYAMGMTFYEMATLQNAFDVAPNANMEEWRRNHLYEAPIPPHQKNTSLTIKISQVIMKMIEKSTNKRYKSWEEIRNDLSLDNLPKSKNADQITSMLKQHMEKSSIKRSKELEAEKTKQEKLELQNLIFSQFKNDIYIPIKGFIDEFNKQCVDGFISLFDITHTSTFFRTIMELVSKTTIQIDLRVLSDEDFIREVPMDFERGTIRKVVRPILPRDNKKVLAWGYIKNNKGIGYNLLLLENKEELYGEWVLLSNSQVISREGQRNRPQQFVYELSELEKEIPLIGAFHIYRTEVIPYSDTIIQEFIRINN
ncbi:serine/threonine-protein kinase [Bacillus pseudomycoides]|uniref:serine/threonine-protein kinase n=1 Tax=Bacillus pseudomycoides TaxID=64104 RepID=UPI000BF3602B|nr:serine/threonine-protein kinase [Bacillus pseudomycoides]PFX51356.1 hypothetical protein COL31_16175 [Bacillus pseudomycoides]PFZ79885.1 hypothetical protein COL69_22650 [Bacillus pseudomycoides]PGE07008.1 hypothetical protein COM51_29950 [Bacillus pseudomycoides]